MDANSQRKTKRRFSQDAIEEVAAPVKKEVKFPQKDKMFKGAKTK